MSKSKMLGLLALPLLLTACQKESVTVSYDKGHTIYGDAKNRLVVKGTAEPKQKVAVLFSDHTVWSVRKANAKGHYTFDLPGGTSQEKYYVSTDKDAVQLDDDPDTVVKVKDARKVVYMPNKATEGYKKDLADESKLDASVSKDFEAKPKTKKSKADKPVKPDTKSPDTQNQDTYRTDVGYTELVSQPTTYRDTFIQLKGTVLQALKDRDVQCLVYLDDEPRHLILVTISGGIVNDYPTAQQAIDIYGIAQGLVTYKSASGGQYTVPAVDVVTYTLN